MTDPLNQIDLQLDRNNLYREDSFTDLQVGEIRRLTPVQTDGSDDPGRSPVFIGQTQIMTPQGPLPVQGPIEAATLAEAIGKFPVAMKAAVSQMVEEVRRMQQQERQQESRIVVPGR